jgi:bifunctional non-homologous end joining protein LigD
MPPRVKAAFLQPMLLQRADALPDDAARWEYELKLDGYRAIAFKTNGKVHLRSRNDKNFNARYPHIVRALAKLPDDTVVDGEILAFDENGTPSFNALQHFAGARTPIAYYVFDVMVLKGRDLRREALDARRALLEQHVVPVLEEPARYPGVLAAGLQDVVAAVKAQGLEGVVAKRRDSGYEAGRRSGAWLKMRINRGQEFVIGGYTIGTKTFDALVLGYYEGARLIYVGRTRNGFTPAVRERLFRRFRPLEIRDCPFVNLPEERSGRWGQGLTGDKMSQCRWLKPSLVAEVQFLEWTADHHLRHPKFAGLREDKRARNVIREEPRD